MQPVQSFHKCGNSLVCNLCNLFTVWKILYHTGEEFMPTEILGLLYKGTIVYRGRVLSPHKVRITIDELNFPEIHNLLFLVFSVSLVFQQDTGYRK